MNKTCFVIMPIGNQKYGNVEISAADLRNKYNDLIKEAICNVKENLEVIRADDIASPGIITTDILIRLMYADYVVADVTYPNPNVFYELGIRHACRSKTILIKEKIDFNIPFEISNLRYIEYENSVTGLKKLSFDLKNYFEYFDKNPNSLDNHFLETAKASEYKFLKFDNEEEQKRKNAEMKLFLKMVENPKVLNSLLKDTDPKTAQLFKELAKSPETAEALIEFLINSGSIKL